MLAVHRLEDIFASALDGQVDELVDALVVETFQEGVGVTQHVTRVAHAQAYLVVARNFVKNSLHQFGEVCSCIEPVAAAVLTRQLDFDAAVCNEVFDLLHDIGDRVAVQAAFYESRGTVGAGIEATFLDVDDSHQRRFSQRNVAAHPKVNEGSRSGGVAISSLQLLQTCKCYFV